MDKPTLDAASWAMIGCGALSFIALQFQRAPYGRYSVGAGGLYAWQMPGRLAWILQELPALLGVAYTVIAATTAQRSLLSADSVNVALMGLFVLHYVHRTFIFPLRLRNPKPTPVLVFLMAAAFCTYNGLLQSQALLLAPYPAGYTSTPQFACGVSLFFLGMAINIHSDSILINLRKPGETGYKIPTGGMFEFVSGANFFGEIVEWAGFAIACWSLPSTAFALFTFCNTGPRGHQHHNNYLEKFKDAYPKHRKALIPFLW